MDSVTDTGLTQWGAGGLLQRLTEVAEDDLARRSVVVPRAYMASGVAGHRRDK